MRWLWPLTFALGACSAEYAVRIQASDELLDGAVYAEVAIIANCLSQETAGPVSGDPHVLYELSDNSAPTLGSVPEGNHGLFARFIDDECNVRAVGCQEVVIEEGGDASLVVEMRAASGFACRSDAQCVSGRCVSATDAAVDGTNGDSGLLDAASSDAGVHDASAEDGAVEAGPIDVGPDVDLCSTVAVCDDFEGDTFVYETNLSGDSSVDVSTAEAHSGVQSVLIHAAGSSIAATFDLTPFDGSETGERWIRAWYLLPTAFVGLTPLSLDSGDNSITIYTTGEDYTALATYLFPDSETTAASRVPLPTGRWTCVEMHLDYDGPNTAEVFVDGAAAAEMTTALPNAFNVVRFGAAYRDPMDPADYDIYVDDIAMAPERMGCD